MRLRKATQLQNQMNERNRNHCFVFLILICCASLTACDLESKKQAELLPNGLASTIDHESIGSADESKETLKVLFVGNSHTAPIPKLLTAIFAERSPEIRTHLELALGTSFLSDRLEQSATTDLIASGEWDYVVLQAQKYSTSGKYKYSTDGAVNLAEMAKKSGSRVIMYSEWSRRGFPDEYKRVRAIHDSISEVTGASVAPIGEAWKLAELKTDRDLYHADGNHASKLGSYLNACVFYSLLTQRSPLTEASDENDSADRRLLEQAAWEAVQESLQK